MKKSIIALSLTMLIAVPVLAEGDHEHEHFDISPYLIDGQLLAGGRSHDGDVFAPPIYAYGFEFGEDAGDPYNPSDPGVNQAPGVGNLPVGAALSYNILSDLNYWDGVDEPEWATPGDSYISLLTGTQARSITADSGAQTGSYISSVHGDGGVHEHFTTSLFAEAGAGNIPGQPGYLEPTEGIYAFQLELTLLDGSTSYTSNPFWLVFNNGADEHAHHEAMESLVPEPASLMLLGLGGALIGFRRR